MQVNNNAWRHNSNAFDGKPQRFRAVKADYQRHVAELLAKATQGGKLDGQVSRADQEKLLAALRQWGALDQNYACRLSVKRDFCMEPPRERRRENSTCDVS